MIKKQTSVFKTRSFNILYLIPLLALIALIIVTKVVFVNQKSDLDDLVFDILKPFINETNTSIMVFFTTLGNHEIVLTGNILLFLYLAFIRKQTQFAVKIASIALGGVSMMHVLKNLFSRPRPSIPLLEPAIGYSFPSGHALNSVIFYGLLAYVSLLYIKNEFIKFLIMSILLVIIGMICISRIYINVHYVTDVIAGLSIGILWLFFWIGIMNNSKKRMFREHL